MKKIKIKRHLLRGQECSVDRGTEDTSSGLMNFHSKFYEDQLHHNRWNFWCSGWCCCTELTQLKHTTLSPSSLPSRQSCLHCFSCALKTGSLDLPGSSSGQVKVEFLKWWTICGWREFLPSYSGMQLSVVSKMLTVTSTVIIRLQQSVC